MEIVNKMENQSIDPNPLGESVNMGENNISSQFFFSNYVSFDFIVFAGIRFNRTN